MSENMKWWELSNDRRQGAPGQAVKLRVRMSEYQMAALVDILKSLDVEHDLRFGSDEGPAGLSVAHLWSGKPPFSGMRIRRIDAIEVVGLAGVNRDGAEVMG